MVLQLYNPLTPHQSHLKEQNVLIFEKTVVEIAMLEDYNLSDSFLLADLIHSREIKKSLKI